jgi:hypothetical protein
VCAPCGSLRREFAKPSRSEAVELSLLLARSDRLEPYPADEQKGVWVRRDLRSEQSWHTKLACTQIIAFTLSGRSTSQFFGVIRVGRQHSVPPVDPDDPAV